MLAELVDKILSLGKIEKEEIGDRIYTKERLHLIHPPEHSSPEPLKFKTLEGLVAYARENIDRIHKDGVFLHVADYNLIHLHGHLIPEACNNRFLYASAKLHAESFMFGHWHDLETFIIAMQSMFVEDAATDSLINMLGSLANETVVENKDDGFSQAVQVKTGITTKSQVEIKNPMTFRPYRTFREVEQPASQFIFRLKKGHNGLQCALYESDGGKWKLDAIVNIKQWLGDHLPDSTIIG